MNLEDLVKPDSVLCNASARSKKHCLEILSELLTRSSPEIANEDVFAKLIKRERLGCTCLNRGIAFPRCRIGGVRKPTAALMKLAEPVDFDSTNGDSVDLVFGMMVPENLSEAEYEDIRRLTELLRDPGLGGRLRAATSSTELSEALLGGQIEPTVGLKSAGQG